MTKQQYMKMIDLEAERDEVRTELQELIGFFNTYTPEMHKLEQREVTLNRALHQLGAI